MPFVGRRRRAGGTKRKREVLHLGKTMGVQPLNRKCHPSNVATLFYSGDVGRGSASYQLECRGTGPPGKNGTVQRGRRLTPFRGDGHREDARQLLTAAVRPAGPLWQRPVEAKPFLVHRFIHWLRTFARGKQ